MPKPETVTKRRVVMRNFFARADADGNPYVETHEATDLVPEHLLDVYLADARTRWAYVDASETVEDAGETVVPAHLEGKTAADFAKYGDHTTGDNALDEHLEAIEPGSSANPHYAR